MTNPRLITGLTTIFIVASLSGCAQSRFEQLRSKANRVESALLKERTRVTSLSSTDPSRQARIDRLTNLRGTLSAANIGLGTVPIIIPPEQREIAYSVLEEAYGTIEWNIPLDPGQPMKPLPSQFQGGVLKLNP
jgi:hypothetical protein